MKMEKLDKNQLEYINWQQNQFKDRIDYLQSVIKDQEDKQSMKYKFFAQQIKQLKVMFDSLQQIKKNNQDK